MIHGRDALRQQIEALRDAGMRAQSLAREIIQAHEHGDFPPARPSNNALYCRLGFKPRDESTLPSNRPPRRRRPHGAAVAGAASHSRYH